MKWLNLRTIGIEECEDPTSDLQKTNSKILAENFPEVKKDMSMNAQEHYQTRIRPQNIYMPNSIQNTKHKE